MAKKPTKGDGTQKKILKAAHELFVEHGYTGVSMGKIAAKAGVNHSLLFHHFGNKENLWMEVKLSIVKESQSISSILPPINLSLKDFLSQLMTNGVSYYRNNPDLIRLMNWQRLDSEKDRTLEKRTNDEMLNWIAATKEFQSRGELNADLSPELVITLVYAVVSSAGLDPNAFNATDENMKKYIEFCVDRLVKALQ